MAELSRDAVDLILAREEPSDAAGAWLRSCGFDRPDWAQRLLRDLVGRHPDLPSLAALLPRILALLRDSADPEMGLLNLARFCEDRSRQASLLASLSSLPHVLDAAVLLFSTSQFLSDILIQDVGHFDWVRTASARGSVADRDRMTAELLDEARAAPSQESRLAALRRFKRREILRIGSADIVRGSSLEAITADISNLADAELEVAYRICLDRLYHDLGTPRTDAGTESRLAILAMGKLGGRELNYSSDIDLVFVYAEDGSVEPAPGTRRRGTANQEFFNRLAEDIIRCMAQPTEQGFVFRVDTRLRPNGQYGPLTRGLAGCIDYYTTVAEMWERQALLKARCVAGDPDVGDRFLREVMPTVYRRYLTFEEIQEIKRLKKQMERQVAVKGQSETGVKLGTGGIRDVEYIVQFHQLLLGGENPGIRSANTLDALHALGDIGALLPQEVTALELAYRFLRKTEHRLMTLHHIKRHDLPTEEREVRGLAIRMGFQGEDGQSPAAQFLAEYRRHTETVRRVFHRAFGELFRSEKAEDHPEVDMILSPDLPAGRRDAILREFGFADPAQAFIRLNHLAEEDSPFLRTPRTRQYLATVMPVLLQHIQETPNPDETLMELDRVVSSLGAKTMLYHWLSTEREALPLLLQICSAGQFLVNHLTTQPGMLDELVDSLAVVGPGDRTDPEEILQQLLTGAEEPLAILSGFRHSELLRIGTWDILGRLGILETFRDISNLAERLLRAVTAISYRDLVARYGEPLDSRGQPIPFAVLALGKFGGQELNYFSDLDVLYAYEQEGQTEKGLYASDFFTRLAQNLTRMMSQPSRFGRLFDIDARLRPQGEKGPLVCSMDYLGSYYRKGEAQTWERLALTKLRPVAGSVPFGASVAAALHEWVYSRDLSPAELNEIAAMRRRLEESVRPDNLKRGRGGIVDIEFLAQILRLRYGRQFPSLRVTNEMLAIGQLESLGLLHPRQGHPLREHYEFLRRIENRLRMVTNRSSDDLPEDTATLDRLGYSIGRGKHGGTQLHLDVRRVREECRTIYSKVLAELSVQLAR